MPTTTTVICKPRHEIDEDVNVSLHVTRSSGDTLLVVFAKARLYAKAHWAAATSMASV